MRSRRRRLQRQRKKTCERFANAISPEKFTVIRVWGRPRGCFDNAGKIRSS